MCVCRQCAATDAEGSLFTVEWSPLVSNHDKSKCHGMLLKFSRLTFLRLALIMMVLGLSCFLVLLASAAAICRLSMSKARDPPDLACPGLQQK